MKEEHIFVRENDRWLRGCPPVLPAADFNDNIVEFFKKYARGELRERLKKAQKEIEVKYLDYDWSSNGK